MGQLDSRPDGVDVDPADRHDQDSYPKAEQALTRQRVPILIHADNPHERLFIAALDGTGNSKSKDAPENWSAVARIAKQIETSGPSNIGVGYVEGTFTQDNPNKNQTNGITGFTFARHVEPAYDPLCKPANT